MLLCDSDDYEDIVLDESETDEEEHISEREDDSESERVQQAIQKIKKPVENDLCSAFLSEWHQMKVGLQKGRHFGKVQPLK
ncbi:hypothetical protein NPIL_225241 [Nephila pilipes]|uniref:Uncharacterized protein n=1 Tax=Nephila pilipes TaxID=299642 RepID=A0A8X6QWE5_NEPPI|nr:hypothetical protein NPIL_225241 [Nephila pilipes]